MSSAPHNKKKAWASIYYHPTYRMFPCLPKTSTGTGHKMTHPRLVAKNWEEHTGHICAHPPRQNVSCVHHPLLPALLQSKAKIFSFKKKQMLLAKGMQGSQASPAPTLVISLFHWALSLSPEAMISVRASREVLFCFVLFLS